MASIKVKLRPSTIADCEGTIYYQIIHDRKVRQLLTNYKLFPAEWDERRSMVTAGRNSERKSFILSIRERIRWDMERLTKIGRKLDAEGLIYTADEVIDEFNRYAHEYSLFNFMESLIARLKQNGKTRTSETYRSTLNSFKKYIPPAVYNRAVEDDIIENRNPFRHVYTGVDKTVKRALPLALIKKIKVLDLSLIPTLDYARDMFLMSFYLRGMSFIDMAFLRKTDLENRYVTYRRRKTGQQLIIEWTKEMQMILDKYPENNSDYLLPIIRNTGTNERCTYRNAGYNINHNLKRIAEMVGITIPLTLYVARHSWASAAKAKGIPVSVISEGMGHDSEATTQIYLASLDTSAVDKANSLILRSLK